MGSLNGGKTKVLAFKLASNIEQWTNLHKVFEDRIIHSQVEFSLWEFLRIAKREFHDLNMDLVKRKR
jgi:predicted ester cyclase